jgi:hypothetical protein
MPSYYQPRLRRFVVVAVLTACAALTPAAHSNGMTHWTDVVPDVHECPPGCAPGAR